MFGFFHSTGDGDPAERRPLYYFLIVSLGVGALASLFTEPNIPVWYADLVHPAFAPPAFLFAPVWTALYVVMGVAGWLVWKKTGLQSAEMAAFALQLALNLAWTALFFGLHRMGAALAALALLDLAALAALLLFLRRSKAAGLLEVPCLGWSGFTTGLVYEIWRLNP
ncbi:MAG TPA: TspO/MBR family protein [Rhizomicrobium sp.]|jgi:tryptophan-rich sensory protein|nr:TspO/MBR family protein [Rhizomicrobium sp.]